MGAVAAVGAVGTAYAQDQNATQTQNNQPQTLQTIVVTGSHIRRVDLETANPVVTVDAAQIQKAGAVTVGDLIQQLPAVTGSPQNTRVNNAGGTGGTFANLRGLGTGRTLVLVDGHRVLDNDLNKVPVEMIERVEVLTDGGAVTYGSDAIGGVINFILKKNYQGAQVTLDYGISDHDDAERKGASFIFGQTSDKGSILAGVDYNKYAPIFAGNRKFSKDALYLYYGNVYAFGSSRTPQAHPYTKAFSPDPLDPDKNTTGSTYAPGTACSSEIATGGTGTSLSDYKCYTGADAYNYQVLNYDLTPQERANAFFKGDYQLTDNVQAYVEYFHNKTTSSYAIAPIPFDANSDGITISKNSIYNPFGVDFGPGGNNPTTFTADRVDANGNSLGITDTWTDNALYNYRTRFTSVGQRKGEYSTVADQGIIGLRGGIGQTSWQWDFNYNYGHNSVDTKLVGDPVYNQAFKNAVGPSMIDPTTGAPICVTTPGDATTVISGCTPLNIFNQADPTVAQQLDAYLATFFFNSMTVQRSYNASVNGTLATLPAGDMQLAVGADYRKLYAHSQVDYLSIINTDPTSPAFGTCSAPQSACSSGLRGGYDVKEAYAELFIPIVKDVPFLKSLNVTLGDRYSKYSLAGSTNNVKIALEWRPIDDLLLRGTVQNVFRAPTLGQLFTSPTGNAPAFNDPCIGLSSTEIAAHSNACQNVPPNATFQQLQGGLSQTTGVVSGSAFTGYPLKPEFGKSFDWGVVYDPHFIPGLSVSADLWRVYLNNTITTIGAQTAANVCFSNNSSPFCGFLHRFPNGQMHYVDQPTVNLGRLDTRGVDMQASYRIPQMSWLPGQFTAWVQGTYLAEYTNVTVPGDPNGQVAHVAGHYYKDYGSYPRVRGQAGLNWNMGPWEASWRAQYIGHEQVGSWNPAENENGESGAQLYSFRVPSIVYNYLEVGYNIEPLNTKLQFGVDNVFDKQPPIFTQSNVLNGDTDVNTYDTIGRFYWARATIKF
ncbi:MAG TPA: TonB-dependent receptor [Rhodanobacteraceae bacterium]|nr:TonB-dependent receptor [Rhodanobacteraceae bacterium]